MDTTLMLAVLWLGLTQLLVAGCGAAPATAPAGAPVSPSANGANSSTPIAARASAIAGLTAQSNDGGGVTVSVTPLALRAGAALQFDIALNTHSVDLRDDMLKSVVLRDDAGEEHAPTLWEGPGPGGHHRTGRLTFAALPASTRSVTLVVRNIGGVPERVFRWDLSP